MKSNSGSHFQLSLSVCELENVILDPPQVDKTMLTWLNEKFGEDSESDSSDIDDDSEMKGLLLKRKHAVER